MDGLQIDRRKFLKGGLTTAAMLGMGINPLSAWAKDDFVQVTILHTNDVHSRIEPFPMDGSKNQGLGGTARRAALISKIRNEQENVLLLDAGDIFQGTPYFNRYGGELEMKLMSAMEYDAGTMGNHDFDNGLEGFYKQLPHAKFPFLVSNYDFSDTIMAGHTIPYKVFKKAGLKIGIFGLGVELAGLVDKKSYGNAQYLDPIQKANEIAGFLKNEKNCTMVICLSHLGYSYRDKTVSDMVLAQSTKNIDLIIGGHTHTFMPKPEDIKNMGGAISTINQVGFAGINLGRIDYFFNKEKKNTVEKRAGIYTINGNPAS